MLQRFGIRDIRNDRNTIKAFDALHKRLNTARSETRFLNKVRKQDPRFRLILKEGK